MSFSWARVGAILQKELRDYRRNRFVVYTMAFLPLIFIAAPMIQLFTIKASITSAKLDTRIGLSLLYMLIVPAIIPSVLSAYSVVGEREQGTLEPVLTTPILREEFLIGKALAALLPTLAVAYVIFGIFLGAAVLFAHPAVASAVFERDHLLVQLLFTPLVAGWSIWVGIAISTRMSDVRAAQQLSVLGQPATRRHRGPMSFNVITPSLGLALGLAAALLLIDGLAWRVVAAMFDRERLVTGGSALTAQIFEPITHTRGHPGERREAGGGNPATGQKRDHHGASTWHVPRPARRQRRRIDRIEPDDRGADRAGHHTLQVKDGSLHQSERPFDTADGEIVNFRCYGGRTWPIYLASLVKPDLALTLKRE